MRGGHLLKHWSSTQQTVALSSGEAELKGIVKGAAEGMGIQNIAKDLSIYYDVHIYIYIPTPMLPWEWLPGKEWEKFGTLKLANYGFKMP